MGSDVVGKGSERPAAVTAIAIAYVIALSLWAGGLVVLGAVVAPTVFGIVPAPTSADAMTVVFRKFDVIAMTCSVIVLLAEAGLAWRGGKATRLDLLRAGAAVLASALAMVEGLWLAPAIHGLHRAGAVRGLGESGLALERLHRHAEAVAKTEVVLLVALVVLVVVRVRRAAVPPP
jgi:hypothetical protein